MHLTGVRGKYLLHAAQIQLGLEQAPSTNAGKLRLVDALMGLIKSNKLGQVMPSARLQDMDTDQGVLLAKQISADPLPFGPWEWQGRCYSRIQSLSSAHKAASVSNDMQKTCV